MIQQMSVVLGEQRFFVIATTQSEKNQRSYHFDAEE